MDRLPLKRRKGFGILVPVQRPPVVDVVVDDGDGHETVVSRQIASNKNWRIPRREATRGNKLF